MDHTLGKILVRSLTREPALSPCYLSLRQGKIRAAGLSTVKFTDRAESRHSNPETGWVPGLFTTSVVWSSLGWHVGN